MPSTARGDLLTTADTAGTGTTISIEAATYDEGPLSFYKPGRVTATNGTVRIE